MIGFPSLISTLLRPIKLGFKCSNVQMLNGLIKYFNKSLMESIDLSWSSQVLKRFLSLILVLFAQL
jgi:hypothetical protein